MPPNIADGIINSEDPDQTAQSSRGRLIWVCTFCPKSGLGICRHLRVKSMPLAFNGIFRNNPEYSGITLAFPQKLFLTDINLVKSSRIYRIKL